MSLYPIYQHEMIDLAKKFQQADIQVFGMLTMMAGDYQARALHHLIHERDKKESSMGGGDIFHDDRIVQPDWKVIA